MSYWVNATSGDMMTYTTWGMSNNFYDTGNYTYPVTVPASGVSLYINQYNTTLTYTGLLLRVYNNPRTAGQTVTFYVNSPSGAVFGMTVNMTDLPAAGWFCLHIPSSIWTMSTTTWYIIVSGGGGNLQLCTNATGQLLYHFRSTNTGTAAPATGDSLFVVGDITGQGALNTSVVTVSNPSANPMRVMVGTGGAATFNTALTSNTLTLQTTGGGGIEIGGGGQFNIGSSGTPIPAGHNYGIYFNQSTAGDAGISVLSGGSLNIYGSYIRNQLVTNLTANATAGQNTINVASVGNWTVGDYILIGPTGTTYNQGEVFAISGISGTLITISGTLAYAHSGTNNANGNTRAYVFLYPISSANMCSISVYGTLAAWLQTFPGASVNVLHCQYMAGNYLNNTVPGITLGSSDNFQYNVINGYGSAYTSNIFSAVILQGNAGYGVTFANNLMVNLSCPGSMSGAVNVLTGGAGHMVTNNYVAQNYGFTGIVLYDPLANVSNNTIVGSAWSGINAVGTGAYMTNNVAQSCASSGFYIDVNGPVTCSGNVAWCNTGYGFNWILGTINGFANCSAYGNSTANLYIVCGLLGTISGCTFIGGYPTNAPINVLVNGAGSYIDLESCTITGSGTYDISVITSATLLMRNCSFNTYNVTQCSIPAAIISYGHMGVAANFQINTYNSMLTNSTTVYNTAAPSLTMAGFLGGTYQSSLPGNYGPYGRWMCAMNNGQTTQLNIWYRLSVSGDGVAYNGTAPQLFVDGDAALGQTATVLATGNTTGGVWQHLSGSFTAPTTGVYGFYLQGSGSAGWINVDDVMFSVSNDTKSMSFLKDSVPVIVADTNTNFNYGA